MDRWLLLETMVLCNGFVMDLVGGPETDAQERRRNDLLAIFYGLDPCCSLICCQQTPTYAPGEH